MAAKKKGVQKKVSKVGAKKAGKSARKKTSAGAKSASKGSPKKVSKSTPSKGASKARPAAVASVKADEVKSAAKPAKPKSTSAKASAPVKVGSESQVNAGLVGTPTKGLEVGDVVPGFEALDQAGQKVSNRDWAGAPYVLYFYPKDDTPGCTTEACGFRDELPSFSELGVKVVGCSPDSPNAHTRFATKYGLQFTLLADIEKDLARLFGVWKLKQNYGREYMGVERSTFLIDKSGKVARQWRGVRVAGHISEVLSAVRGLG